MQSLLSANNEHPLVEVLFDASMLVRETLSVWEMKWPHNAALESMTARQKRIGKRLKLFRKDVHRRPRIVGLLEQNDGKHGWKPRVVRCEFNSVFFSVFFSLLSIIPCRTFAINQSLVLSSFFYRRQARVEAARCAV
jgi:hypothetical protein